MPRTSLLSLIALVASACGGLPPAPAYPGKDDAFSAPKAVARPGLPGDTATAFKLQPGDVIDIELAGEPPRVIRGVIVDGTGHVHVPLVGDLSIAGLGLTEAERTLESALKHFDRFAQVTVTVADPRGQRATVLGAVVTQGAVTLIPGSRVTDVIALAGGPLTSTDAASPVPLADLHGAVVIRGGRTLPVSVARALQGDPLHNVFMRPGDHVYVPPALGTNISVLGQVGAPRMFPHQAGLRLSQVLAMSGGVTAGADKGDIRVIRGTLDAPRVYQASLIAFVDGDSHDVLMQAGDIVFVTDHAIEDIGEVLSIVSPALSLGLTATALGVSLNNQSQNDGN